jgi:FAD:protein FMN transferase
LLVPNVRLDLGGIAKGYATDQALKVLQGRGVNRALVAASGDIAIGGSPPGQPGWRVALASPGPGTNAPACTLLLHNAGVSTSGDAEQSIILDGVRYSHILDPATGLGLTHRIQASVIAPNATTTDALATTVCVLGAERGLNLIESLPGTAALVLTDAGEKTRTTTSSRFRKIPQANSKVQSPKPKAQSLKGCRSMAGKFLSPNSAG